MKAFELGRRYLTTTNNLRSLVIAEQRDGKIAAATLPVITAAQELTNNVSALVVGDSSVDEVVEDVSKIRELERVYVAKHGSLKNHLAEPIADVISHLQRKQVFSHLLAPSSTFGKNVLSRTAGILGIEQLSDVIKIRDANTFDRPIYAGNAVATVKYNQSGTRALTIRGTAFESASLGEVQCEIEYLPPEELEMLDSWLSRVQWIKQETSQSDRPELGSAKIVVAGGRALQSKDNFKLVDDLAQQLGGAIGATRAAVDAGYAPNDWQVGQTGKVVAPDLYIALGISGAIQHLAGMTSSKTIVAINTDPDAPIFEVADYGLVQDIFSAIPELRERLGRLPSQDNL